MKVKTAKQLKHIADKMYQQKYVAENPKCLLCQNPTNCMHHFIHKSQSNNLRYSKENGIPVCISCHSKIHLAQDAEIINKIINIKGQEWADDLYAKRHLLVKMNKVYLEDIILKLED